MEVGNKIGDDVSQKLRKSIPWLNEASEDIHKEAVANWKENILTPEQQCELIQGGTYFYKAIVPLMPKLYEEFIKLNQDLKKLRGANPPTGANKLPPPPEQKKGKGAFMNAFNVATKGEK